MRELEDIDLIALFREPRRKRTMKSLGVQKVHIDYYTDNIKTKSEIEKRVVYAKADGTFHCNYFTGDTREVTQRNDGSFYWRIDMRSIAQKTISDVLKGL